MRETLGMSGHHLMRLESDDGDGLLFRCHEDGCGRTVIVRRSGEFVVLDRGDFFATHAGAKGSVALDVG